ncbi:MAG: VanZ family protein [Rhodothermales bacterium]
MPTRYIFAIGWTLLIVAGCSIPGNDIPQIGFDLFEFDKLIHFTFFLLYGWLWSKALPNIPSKLLWVGLSGICFGVATEIYQGMLPWDRTPDPMDAIANMLGLLTAILAYHWKG